MKWIDVKDKLPKGEWGILQTHLSEEVLVVNSCSTSIGYYNRNDGTWYTGEPIKNEWIDKITHWMPLPKSPHDKETDKNICTCDLVTSWMHGKKRICNRCEKIIK